MAGGPPAGGAAWRAAHLDPRRPRRRQDDCGELGDYSPCNDSLSTEDRVSSWGQHGIVSSWLEAPRQRDQRRPRLGWGRVGPARGAKMQREQDDYILAGSAPNARPYRVVREDLDPRELDTGRRKHPLPCIGDRIGELAVVGYRIEVSGRPFTDRGIAVRCSCGAPEYFVSENNLRSGKTTRCMYCGIRRAGETRKAYAGYREIIIDDGLRASLLSRINGIYRRCYKTDHADYHNYGARGIRCWWYDQYGVGAVKKRDKMFWRRKMLEYLVTLDGFDQVGTEIDRADNSKGYEPGNLRFITRKQNMGNKRTVWQLQAKILELESRNAELEQEVARLRSNKLRASKQVYGSNR